MPTRIDTQDILDLTITTGDIANAAVTPAKADLTATWDFDLGTLLYKTPTAADEVAIKSYVDAVAAGMRDPKDAVRVLSDSNVAIATGGLLTIDGVTLAAGNRVLLVGQTDATQNGIYIASAGAWSRSADADENTEVTQGMYALVIEGTTYGNTGWVLTSADPVTIGASALNFVQFTGVADLIAGAGLTKTGNQIDVGAGTGIIVNADTIEADDTVLGFLAGANSWSAKNIFTNISGNLFHNAAGASLVVGTGGVTVTTASNQIVLGLDSAQVFDKKAAFLTLGNTSSLDGERAFAVSTGLTTADGGANGAYTVGLDFSVVPQFSQFVSQEVPSGTIGGNDTFTLLSLASDIASGSVRVYKRGLRMKEGDDYSLSSSISLDKQYVVFASDAVPTAGSNLFCDYMKLA